MESDHDLLTMELLTDDDDLRELIGERVATGPAPVCDKCKDAKRTIVAGVILLDLSDLPLLLCRRCLEDFENTFTEVDQDD